MPGKTNNVIHANFSGGSNRGVIANQVGRLEIKAPRTSIKIGPPDGSIASDLYCRNYVKYLIDRYHEFKKIEVGKENMKYAAIYQTIKRNFGAKWDLVPLSRFNELSTYIQGRIDKTRHGRIRKSRGTKNYSSFGERLEKLYAREGSHR